MLIAVAALALRAAGSSPPGIAEFAPVAQHPIQNAPSELQARAGGKPSLPGTLPSPSPSSASGAPAVPPGAALLRCVGDPPRQIEDPQSPPCVPFWEGAGNGGATSRGVTDSEIDIAAPNMADGNHNQYYQDLQLFFNKRFELYGRHIKLQPCCGNTKMPADPVLERADADTVASQYGSFASLAYIPESGIEYFYYDQLAVHHIISAATYAGWRSEADRAANSPYEWSVLSGGNDVGESGLGSFVCGQLKGGSAVYAGPPLTGQPRIFGLLETDLNGYGADDTRLRQVLQNCGITPAITERYDTSNNPLQGQTAILALRNAHVTTVICLCEAYGVDSTGMPAATNQNYYPEWVVSTYMNFDVPWAGHLAPEQQAQHLFGLSFNNKDLPAQDQPVTWALREVDPSWKWEPGSADLFEDPTEAQWYLYDDLLLLASGIQMAGPNLTPQSFQAALYRTKFPNPGCGGPPYYQACVGFPGVHNMFQDATVIWWNPAEASYGSRFAQEGGAYCYAGLGARFSPYSESSTPVPLFTGTCR